jgi:hypothetical protein
MRKLKFREAASHAHSVPAGKDLILKNQTFEISKPSLLTPSHLSQLA